ncbi:MAG TPA: GNAT family protein [Phenylobacterium sp.]|nr:GNAT family protein [Phenylobacterium sp.]
MNSASFATANFTLTPLCTADRQDLLDHLSDPETVAFMDIEPMVDLAAADAMIGWAERLGATSGGIWWAMRDRSGAFVGTGGFAGLVRERGSRGEVSYNVVRSRWQQGVMAEVLPTLLGYGFGPAGLHRIEATVTPGNVASAALLERFGFQREATLRDYALWKGRYWDQWLYARLAP